MYHPWRRFGKMPEVTLVWRDLPGSLIATTDGRYVITVDRRLMQVDRRCAIDHELAHIELGHVGGATWREERAARLLSARRLVSLESLGDALAFTLDLTHVAWSCWVTPLVLSDRLDHLTPREHKYLMRRTKHHRAAGS